MGKLAFGLLASRTAKKSIYEYGSSKDMTSYKWYFTENVSVGAGSYNAKKSAYEFGSSKDMVSYKWWFTESVPGLIVKYDHELGDDCYSKGELKSIKNNYESKFDSF